jgi:hypothetical protein
LKIIDFFFFLLFRIKSNSSTWKSSDSYFFLFFSYTVCHYFIHSKRERMSEWLVVQVLKYEKKKKDYIYRFFSIIVKRKMKKKLTL